MMSGTRILLVLLCMEEVSWPGLNLVSEAIVEHSPRQVSHQGGASLLGWREMSHLRADDVFPLA